MNKRRRFIAKRRRKAARLARLYPSPRHAVICAWCEKTIRRGSMFLSVSHGICPACVDRVEEQERAIAAL